MYLGKTIAVVIPCYNEETQITKVLLGIPSFVDLIYVVDDASRDQTFQIALNYANNDERITVLRHKKNSGVGAAIATGYQQALIENADVTAVMAGDGQMDPTELELVIYPVVEEIVDYCKGNRFFYLRSVKKIPRTRLFGNFILSAITKIVSGYWHISDTQCGYTAISKEALASIDIDNIYPSYGCPNDILTKLNIAEMRVGEVAVNPLYGVGEVSKMKITRVICPILLLMRKLFIQRMLEKYVFRTGHPLVLAYALAALLFIFFLLLGLYITVIFWLTGLIRKVALIVAGVTLIIALQLLLNAVGMDFDYNKELSIKLRAGRLARLKNEQRR